MRRLDQPAVLADFVARFRRLTPESPRQWGTMNVHQMASHVGDASDAVLKERPFPSKRRRPSVLIRTLVLYMLPRFPMGARVGANPATKVLDPAAFAADIERAVTSLQRMAAAPAESFAEHHPVFGSMSRKQWLRWAYLHTDHHLRQFAG